MTLQEAFQPFWDKGKSAELAFPPPCDESGILEKPGVVAHEGDAYPEHRGQFLATGLFLVPKVVDNAEAKGIGQGRKNSRSLWKVHTTSIARIQYLVK